MLVLFLSTVYSSWSLCVWPVTPDSDLLLIILTLVAMSILHAWVLAHWHFVKPIQVTNLYSVHEDYFTAQDFNF